MPFKPIFRGRLVRLAAPTPEDNAVFAQWSEDDEYMRLMDSGPVQPLSADAFANLERRFLTSPDNFVFRIRTLDENRLIGFVALTNVDWMNQSCNLGIGIGDQKDHSKGYGTDAIHLILGYAFHELNLYRVGLSVFSYNTGAIRLYEKAGFVPEGAKRAAVERQGQRYDEMLYSILRDEWHAQHPTS